MLPALPGTGREVRGNGEMFPLNGPSWSLFFEYVGNILYAFFLRRLPTRALAWLTALLACGLTWFAVTNQSGYGSIGVGWTIDTTNVLGGTLRMLCPFTVGMLMSRVFKPMVCVLPLPHQDPNLHVCRNMALGSCRDGSQHLPRVALSQVL